MSYKYIIYLICRDGFRIYRMLHYSHCEEKETQCNPLNTKVIRIIYIFSSYLTKKTIGFRYENQRFNCFVTVITVYFVNHTEHTNLLCGRNADLLVSRPAVPIVTSSL